MKAKHSLFLFVFGLCFDFVGALFKILHAPHGDHLLIIGTILKVAGALSFLYKLLTHPKTKDFFDQ
ncbi:hypothetical protein [Ferruginibacter albus]|uniref:hypothetical protein n=1 Tax=Ferruginibacter albus TaxID=2875540 RepID=UPI001CC494A7|nr:hypothetical protein [Ferruginibacter albus]UAY51591.1 hypothetical protein K9M53_13470 [Ferruginibacter albus]